MLPNPLVLLAVAFIPLLFGYLWFHPKLFGGASWYDLNRMEGNLRTEVSKLKLLSTLILNFLLAFGIFSSSVHQFSILGLVGGNAELLQTGTAAAFLAEYGTNYLTFGHGCVHAILQAWLCFALPLLGYLTIFEKKPLKYFLVYAGYWLVNLILMGGIISAWGTVAA